VTDVNSNMAAPCPGGGNENNIDVTGIEISTENKDKAEQAKEKANSFFKSEYFV
jgi:hypothetical protein